MDRGSIRLKNMGRDSSLFRQEGLGIIEHLANYFGDVNRNIENIEEYCEKKRIHFLLELKNKMSYEEYKNFLSNMELYRLP